MAVASSPSTSSVNRVLFDASAAAARKGEPSELTPALAPEAGGCAPPAGGGGIEECRSTQKKGLLFSLRLILKKICRQRETTRASISPFCSLSLCQRWRTTPRALRLQPRFRRQAGRSSTPPGPLSRITAGATTRAWARGEAPILRHRCRWATSIHRLRPQHFRSCSPLPQPQQSRRRCSEQQ